MKVKADVLINASAEAIWQVITDIDQAAERISAIEKVEVLERPVPGLLGLKWRETRTMFGKEATEVMWVTEAEDNVYYQTRAESHGAIYISSMRIETAGDASRLVMEFDGEPQRMGARIMAALTGFIFKGATVKAIQQDLEDIKQFIENGK
ncbi:MAG: SRPBCC family protein [Candidatus Marinimicrobia bacterium]|nr:SRPBCC family protein [Candidatus Neomarinimicrobiota bacterium]MCF7850724.1 SRPBCC family protein [Candidatus Neomarinimicrobiota bacterium]